MRRQLQSRQDDLPPLAYHSRYPQAYYYYLLISIITKVKHLVTRYTMWSSNGVPTKKQKLIKIIEKVYERMLLVEF